MPAMTPSAIKSVKAPAGSVFLTHSLADAKKASIASMG